jgi:hypothetical protein
MAAAMRPAASSVHRRAICPARNAASLLPSQAARSPVRAAMSGRAGRGRGRASRRVCAGCGPGGRSRWGCRLWFEDIACCEYRVHQVAKRCLLSAVTGTPGYIDAHVPQERFSVASQVRRVRPRPGRRG